MTIAEIMGAREAILGLQDEKVSAQLAYGFLKFVKATDGDAEFSEKEKRKVIEECCERDEGGKLAQKPDGSFAVIMGKRAEAAERLAEIGRTEAVDPGIRFPASQIAGLMLTLKEMAALQRFVEEDG